MSTQALTTQSSATWWVECGANLPNGRFTRNHIMPADKVNSFRYRYGNRGVFVTAYMYDSKDQDNANLYGDFYLDFDYEISEADDKEQAFNLIRQEALAAVHYIRTIYGIERDQIRIYFSGSKGVHIVVPKEALGVEPNKNLNTIYKMMAEDIARLYSLTTLDLKIYDNKRLFRLPNSIHQKTGLYKVRISYDELTRLSFSEIIELAKEPRLDPRPVVHKIPRAQMEYNRYIKKLNDYLNRPRNTQVAIKLDYTPPCVEYLLNNLVPQGQRNDTIAFLASFFKQTGMPKEQTEETLLEWNEQKCVPPTSSREVRTTVNSIYSCENKMGCSRARILSKCGGESCKFYKKGM